MHIEKALERLHELDNPVSINKEIGWHVADAIKANEISLYEAFLIHQEISKFKFRAISEPAWSEEPRFTHLLYFLNLKLLCELFEVNPSNILEMCSTVYASLSKERKHYILELYNDLITEPSKKNALEELSRVRKQQEMPDFYYPNHKTIFPYSSNSVEDLLLSKTTTLEKNVSALVTDLIVELSIKE